MLNSILVPLEIATDAEHFKSTFWSVFNTALDVFFALDILVVFNTKIIVEGEEIDDRRQIALAYLKGYFTVDLLAALPVDAVLLTLEDKSYGGLFKPLSLLKLLRLLRLIKVVRRLPHQRDMKAHLKTALLFAELFMYLHFSACVQLLVVRSEALWDNPVYARSETWAARFYDDGLASQYLVCLSAALMINKGKDALPLSLSYCVVETVALMLGIGVYLNVLARFRQIKFELAEEAEKEQEVAS